MKAGNESLEGGKLRVALGNALTQVLVDYTGRGPERARTTIEGDLVVCVFYNVLNRAERMLAESGQGNLVREVRHSFQHAMRTDLVAAVTRLTGREVIAFLSDNHLEPDIAVETFILATDDGRDGDRPRP
jgi:uncharacterized protein YbcI